MILLMLYAIKNPRTLAKVSGITIRFRANLMKRIIDRTWFESKPADFVRLNCVETVTGHIELSAHRPHVWSESGPCDVDVREYSEEEQRDRAEALLKRAAQRAKKNCRHACKSIGADALMTLTYRENMTDIEVCKANLKEFVRRVRRVWPGFRAVAGFEQQKRGAYHVHMATERVPHALQRHGIKVKSFDLFRSIWRAVAAENGGNVDVQKRKRNSKKTPARIAAYLSKYITKSFADGEKWSNRWTTFGKIDHVKKISLGEWPDMRSAIEFAYGCLNSLHQIASTFLHVENDIFFLAAEPPPRGA